MNNEDVTTTEYCLSELVEERCDGCSDPIKNSPRFYRGFAFYLSEVYDSEILEYFFCSTKCMKEWILK